MFGLHLMDVAALVLYLVGITVIGVLTAKKVHTSRDFFMPRRFGRWYMAMHAFGTGTHSDQAVAVASKTYTNGLSGIWYQWLWLFATPFYWLIAPIMRRFRATTTSDVFEQRFDRSVASLFAVVGVAQLMVNIGVMLKGSGAVIESSTGGHLNQNLAIAAMTVMFVVYGVAGGLAAAIVTDMIQGILTVLFSFMLLPFVLQAVGGLSGMRAAIGDPGMFSLVAPADIGTFYIAVIALNALIGIVTQPHVMGCCAAGRTEIDGRFGFTVGNFIKRFCTVAWCLTGLAAVAYYADRPLTDPDQVFGYVAREFLPRVTHGLLGVFIASLLASVMSSCDAFMVASSALFTENVYRPLRPQRDERHYVLVGRITAAVVVTGGVVFAYWLPGVVQGLEIFWKIPAMMGIAFWLGLFWRRTTVAGAWASTMTGFVVWWLTTQAWGIAWLGGLPMAEGLRFVVDGAKGPEVYLPWQMTFYLSAGLIAGIVVSLFTKPVASEKLAAFYALVRTPVQPDEESEVPCTLPPGVEPAERRELFPGTDLTVYLPSRTSMLGFFGGWIAVALIIYSVVLIARV